jgi:hypothetical protein
MRAFEFHFNPKLKEDLVFDSFCYEPEKAHEKKLGNLYIVGFLKNVLPQNKRLLKRLAEVIKDKYYSSKTNSTERALKGSLKEANKLLEEISKSGDVSWLGNLDFLILSIKDSKLNLAKVGDIKPFLIRTKQITDIEEKAHLEEMEPYPLKVFANIVSGKLAEKDLIVILTEELFQFFKEKNILNKIAKIESLENKELKEILNGRRKDLNNVTGVFLAVNLIKQISPGRKQTISEKDLKEFSLKKIFAPVLKIFEKLPKKSFEKKIKLKERKRKKKGFQIPRIKIKVPEIKIKLPKKRRRKLLINKNIILLLGLILLLTFGFIFSEFEKNKKIKIYSKELEQIQEKLELSESFLILENINPEAFKKANILLEESWNKILLLTKNSSFLPKDFTDQIFDLKNEILNKLSQLNKLEEIESPELVFEFDRKEFVPNNLLTDNGNIYFFTPYSKNIFLLKENEEKKIIESKEAISSAVKISNAVLFLSKPDKLMILKNNDVFQSQLQTPYLNFSGNHVASFNNNLYFLDEKTGQIIKYSFLQDFKWDTPQSWLNQKEEKIIGAQSMSIDSSIWILKDNSIYQYHKGEFQKEIQSKIFPERKDFMKIYTSSNLPYLYILEPMQKRIVILSKEGQIIKQFKSEKFDNLLDFGINENEKILYILNGLKVYMIKMQ